MNTKHPAELLEYIEEYIRPLDRPTISFNEFEESIHQYENEIKELKLQIYVRDCYIESLQNSITDIQKIANGYSFSTARVTE
jgi:hypothetical protein